MRPILHALPWITILLIIGAVQGIRDAPVDAVIFGVVAGLIALDATNILPRFPALRVPFPALALAAGVAAVALVLAPRHGVLAGIVVSAIGIAAFAIAWTRPPSEKRARARRVLRGAVLWATVTVLLCLWELSSFLLGRFTAETKIAHPAVSDLVDPAVDTWPGRILFVGAWGAAMLGLVWVGHGRPRRTS